MKVQFYSLLNSFSRSILSWGGMYMTISIVLTSLSFFLRKKRNQKALVTASRSVATDYFPCTRSLAKNDKTPYGKKVYGVDAAHNNSVSNPIKAKKLAFT